MTNEAATPRFAALRTRRGLGIVVAAAAVGIGLGLLVNVVSPNPVYGFQFLADLGALVLLLLAYVLRRVWVLLLPTGLAFAVGVIAGVTVGLELRPEAPGFAEGTITVALTSPVAETVSGDVLCDLPGQQPVRVHTVFDDSPIRLGNGRGLEIAIGPEYSDPDRADGLGIDIRYQVLSAEGSISETRYVSNPASSLARTGTQAAGSMTFAGLVIDIAGEGREQLDLAGTATWRCPAPS